jgi:hypothetical protein
MPGTGWGSVSLVCNSPPCAADAEPVCDGRDQRHKNRERKLGVPRKATGYRTVTVIGSETLVRPDRRAAILLLTQELGSIAIEVNPQVIETLRRQLSAAEIHLNRKAGSA